MSKYFARLLAIAFSVGFLNLANASGEASVTAKIEAMKKELSALGGKPDAFGKEFSAVARYSFEISVIEARQNDLIIAATTANAEKSDNIIMLLNDSKAKSDLIIEYLKLLAQNDLAFASQNREIIRLLTTISQKP